MIKKIANGLTDRVRRANTDRDALRMRVRELEKERQRLQKSLAKTERERDGYLKTLYAMTRREVHFSEEELKDLEEHGIPFEQALVELNIRKRS